MEKKSADDHVVSRRWYVRTVGVAAMASLAGCPDSGDGPETSPGDRSTDSETPARTPTEIPPEETPTETDAETPTQTPTGTEPLYEQASKIGAADIGSEGLFGWSVAVSDDGATALVGELLDGEQREGLRTYVLSRSSNSWSLQSTLTPSTPGDTERLTLSVALSGDGTTAFVSVLEEVSGEFGEVISMKVYVFEESGGSWSQQGALVPEDDQVGLFGYAMAVSADGTTVLVSNNLGFDDPDGGVVEVSVFQQSGGSWSQQATLDPDGGFLVDSVVSVAISPDGTNAVVGVPVDSRVSAAEEGIAYVFAESSGTWRQQTTLTGDAELNPAFGTSVDISGDGDTVLVSAPAPGGPIAADGAAYVFTQSDGLWSRTATLVPGEDPTGGFGWRVGLSDDGNTAVVIAPQNDGTGGGSAAVFSRSGDAWERSGTLVPGTRTEDQVFGYSGAIAGDGNTVLIGAFSLSEDESVRTGAVYAYRRTRPLPPSPPSNPGQDV